MSDDESPMAKELRESIEISRSGYGGILPTGMIVDRRKFPDAIPIPANQKFGVPEPKKIDHD